MAGVSTRSLAVRALLALLLVSGSLMHVRAEENIDDLEKDGPAIDNQESEECPSPPDSRLECNLDFQDCLDDPSECTYLYAAPSLPLTCEPAFKRRSGAAKPGGEGALIGRQIVQHGG